MKEKEYRTYKRRGIIIPLFTIFITLGLIEGGSQYLTNHPQKFKNKLNKDFNKVEEFYDKDGDNTLSVKEKYFMYSAHGLEDKSANYIPTREEMRRIIEEYKELDDAQFGNFDNFNFKNLEDSL